MRDAGDFDIRYFELGPFSSLPDLTRGVWEQIRVTAGEVAQQGGGRLVSHSYAVHPLVAAESQQYLGSVILCFDADYVDLSGDLEVSVFDLGPFDSLSATNGALAEEVAIGSYLFFERTGSVFAGLSHSIVTQHHSGSTRFYVSAAVSYRKQSETPTQH